MAIVKLISDFDGVWTNQHIEADYVWKYILNTVASHTGDTPETIDALLQQSKNEMDNTPYDYGWFNGGGVSCYYQEDPFGDNNAIFDYIERSASDRSYSHFKQELARLKDAIGKKTNMTLAEFSNDCFMKSTTQFKLEGKLKPVETAGEVIKKLNAAGVEIVVVSNSKTEKIEHLFRKAGHTVTNENAIVRGRLHAIGDARKFIIDSAFTELPEFYEITDRFKVCLRRSNYFKILLAEMPDYVIGDVFSLDLALPLYLRLNDKRFEKLKVIQRVHKHTPAWVKDHLSRDEFKGIAFMVDSIDELPGILLK
ncbi:MAG TPA: HAD family hydrolase [Ignavibacteria bacterium]|nr:HAD family hydrolase [Ignavibacteria bacterium]HRE11224.1 HAD family hydrolase [Ignavibacteria bacterium]HRF64708.1 HAD family hydrolase [Ignavibacteria bacterium]HRJ03573.1 HAD family hydrolase [Ignavibacteria bacterium]HRJ84158.1 HAD family hydrolase [Ignavibacteria bacterium]